MNDFTFACPTKVYFGEGASTRALAAELPQVGETVMLAFGGGSIKKYGLYDAIRAQLEEAGKTVVDFGGIMPNPTYAKVQEGAALARWEGVDFILAVGGGSVIDCCKIVSVQAKTDADIWQLENAEHKMPASGIPMGAVVTIFGTGAEMNAGAVITNEEVHIKGPLFGTAYSWAALEPALTLTAPLAQAVSGAFDTLSHCMETHFGTPREPNLSDGINFAVQRCVIANLRAMIAEPEALAPRSELFWASAMGENGLLKIGKAGDFQAHMIEHQLGAYTDCNHGFGLAAIHPALYRRLAAAAPEQYARWAVEVWGIDAAGRTTEEVALAGVGELAAFIAEAGLPTTLSAMGISGEGTDEMLRKVAETSIRTPACAVKLSDDDIYELLLECK